MTMTEAWVLPAGPATRPEPGELVLETIDLGELHADEVLIEPLYGCWEANISHAIERSPVDIARQRGEDGVVLGNAAIVRVLQCGPDATGVAEGDICFFVCIGVEDPFGYCELVHGYDAPGTVGVLAKRTKIPARNLYPVPEGTPYSLAQWSTYARYWTAWSNWKVALACWRSQIGPSASPPLVASWGGGVGLAELYLAQQEGSRVAMAASTPDRLDALEAVGIEGIDRGQFPDLAYDPIRYRMDADFRDRYRQAERTFLKRIDELSDGRGVDIFIDNIGTPVHRATLRCLARQGVIATAGWKHGMLLETYRANECINRRLHVHTHACGTHEIPEVVAFQAEHGWLPELDERVYRFEEIPQLVDDYAAGRLSTYFPIFSVNPL